MDTKSLTVNKKYDTLDVWQVTAVYSPNAKDPADDINAIEKELRYHIGKTSPLKVYFVKPIRPAELFKYRQAYDGEKAKAP